MIPCDFPNRVARTTLHVVKWPVMVAPLVQGVRCTVLDGVPYRSAPCNPLIPIRNDHIRHWIEKHCPDGFDGFILGGDLHQDSMELDYLVNKSQSATPTFHYGVMDWVFKGRDTHVPFKERHGNAIIRWDTLKKNRPEFTAHTSVIPHQLVKTEEEFGVTMSGWLALGYQGVTIRDAAGTYENPGWYEIRG